MRTTRLSPRLCPYCGHTLDAATAGPFNPDAEPRPGDVTVCLHCIELLVFDEATLPRKPSGDELLDVRTDPQVQLVMARLRLLTKRRPPPKPTLQ